MATYKNWYFNCKACGRRITLEVYTGASVARPDRNEKLQCPKCHEESIYSCDDFKDSNRIEKQITTMVLGMSPIERRERLRLEIVIATMRYNWAIAEPERGATPALTEFIRASRKECLALRARLKSLNDPAENIKTDIS